MKNLYNISKIIFILFISHSASSQQDAISKLSEIAVVDQKVMMPMRDGVRLATDIYRPKGNNRFQLFFQEPLIILILGEMVKKMKEHIKELMKQ